MNKQRKTSNILNVFQYNETTGAVTLPSTLDLTAPGSSDDSTKAPTTAWVRTLISSLGYVTLSTDQTLTGLKTIVRSGDVLNFKIGTDTLYALKIVYNQNELVGSGEATWSFANTFNNGSGTGITTTPISFFRGVLVTGQRLLSASVNANLLDYYGNNPSGRYPVYAYNTGVQQFASGVIVGDTAGVVNAATGAIADLPAGVVANFKGRVIGSNAVNNNEFVTLSQLTTASGAYLPLSGGTLTGPLNGTSATFSGTGYFGGATSASGLTGAAELIVQNEIGIQNSDTTGPYLRMVMGGLNQNITFVTGAFSGTEPNLLFSVGGSTRLTLNASTGAATFSSSVTATGVTVTGQTDLCFVNATTTMRIARSGSVARFQNYDNGSAANIALNWEGGNVGIGTSSPTEALDVVGSVNIRKTTAPQLLFFESNSGYTEGMRVLRSNDKLHLTYGWNADEEALTVVGTGTTTGFVGIGTISPSTRLNVSHPNHGIGISYMGGSALPSIAGLFTDSSSGQQGYGSLLIKSRTDYSGYSINFYTAGTANVIESRMMITSVGNIGVNCVPDYRLDVNGVAQIRDTLSVTKQVGKFYAQTSASGTTSFVNTGIFYNTSITGFGNNGTYFLTVTGNPNGAGSSEYRAVLVGYIIVTTGYDFGISSVVQNIFYTETLNRQALNISTLSVSVVFWNGSTESTQQVHGTTNNQIRIKITGYNSGNIGAAQDVRITKVID